MPKRPTDLYICDIYESMRLILDDAIDLSFDDFKNVKNMRDAILFRLMIIGEAVNHLPHKVKEKIPEIEWVKIVGVRNLITHEYFGIDEETIYQVIKKDLPKLKLQFEANFEAILRKYEYLK